VTGVVVGEDERDLRSDVVDLDSVGKGEQADRLDSGDLCDILPRDGSTRSFSQPIYPFYMTG
jgi:hypothetical protein